MRKIDFVTPIVLTFNEKENISRCLDSLKCFNKVVVVDSGSTDETLSIVKNYSNVEIVYNKFQTFAEQWNYAISHELIITSWVLALDADYIIDPDFIDEINRIDLIGDFSGFRVSFDYAIFGKKLSKCLYPPIITFFNRNYTTYINDGHCMRAIVQGNIGFLQSKITHDDRKPISRWLQSQFRYAEQEVDLLLNKKHSDLKIQDKLRKKAIITPWLVPLYCLTIGRGLLDGKYGLYYAFQRGIAESILALKLIEKRILR
jgi:glycosyltransferase involved in cell wall biosynthesis